jgi:hypothetical protein
MNKKKLLTVLVQTYVHLNILCNQNKMTDRDYYCIGLIVKCLPKV